MYQYQDRDHRQRICCWCCLSSIFTAGFISFILWLIFHRARPHDPKCSIEYFYVPALNKSLDSRLNTNLSFMVSRYNPHEDKGIYYDDVHISLSSPYTTTNSSALVANYTVPRFYQGRLKTAKKWGQVLPLNNQTVLRAVLPNGSAVFRLDLKTQVRFKNVYWTTKRDRIEVGADVEANGYGVKANKKGIKMKNSSSSLIRSYLSVCVLMNLLVLFVIC